MNFDPLSHRVIGCAIEAHRILGPALLESAYQQCLELELRNAGIPFAAQVTLPIEYKGIQLECGYRLDIVVDGQLIIEIKSVDELHPIHEAQLMTYLRISNKNVVRSFPRRGYGVQPRVATRSASLPWVSNQPHIWINPNGVAAFFVRGPKAVEAKAWAIDQL